VGNSERAWREMSKSIVKDMVTFSPEEIKRILQALQLAFDFDAASGDYAAYKQWYRDELATMKQAQLKTIPAEREFQTLICAAVLLAFGSPTKARITLECGTGLGKTLMLYMMGRMLLRQGEKNVVYIVTPSKVLEQQTISQWSATEAIPTGMKAPGTQRLRYLTYGEVDENYQQLLERPHDEKIFFLVDEVDEFICTNNLQVTSQHRLFHRSWLLQQLDGCVGITGTVNENQKSLRDQGQTIFRMPEVNLDHPAQIVRSVDVEAGNIPALISEALKEWKILKQEWLQDGAPGGTIFIMPGVAEAEALLAQITQSQYRGRLVEVLQFDDGNYQQQTNRIK
jgi:hypothetical protein